MGRIRLAVDYGTSNTVAVVQSANGRTQTLLFDGSPLLPSAVYAGRDGELLVGRDAVRSARLDPGRYEPNPKRRVSDGDIWLADRSWPVTELIAATLSTVAREAARVAGAAEELVLTCPVTWGTARRAVLVEAAGLAHLPAPVLVAEPVAAASYLATLPGHELRDGQVLVVYDLGAGTFDVSVVRRTAGAFEGLARRGLDDLGGIDLDELILDQVHAAVDAASPEAWRRLSAPGSVHDRRAAQALREDARLAKETLSRHASAELPIPLTDQDVLVGREEFDRLATPLLGRTTRATTDAVRAAGLTIREVAGIFLVGGASRVPLAATLLHRATGLPPTTLEQPETVVAQGALLAVPPGTQPAGSLEPVDLPKPADDKPEPLPSPIPLLGPAAPLVPPAEPADNVPASTTPPDLRRRFVASLVILCVVAVGLVGFAWATNGSGAGNHRALSTESATASPSAGTGAKYSKPTTDLCSYVDTSPLGFTLHEAAWNVQYMVPDNEQKQAAGCVEKATGSDGTWTVYFEVDAIFFPSTADCAAHLAADKTSFESTWSYGDQINQPVSAPAFAWYNPGFGSSDIMYSTSDSNLELIIQLDINEKGANIAARATQTDSIAHSMLNRLA